MTLVKKNTVNYSVFGHLTLKNHGICSGFCFSPRKNTVNNSNFAVFSCFSLFFELRWSAIHGYQILRVFFSDNQYFRMFLVSMADIIGSYERLPNDAVRAVAVAKRREYTKPAGDRAPWHRTSVKGRLSTWCPGKRIQSAQRISCFLSRIDFNILKMNERSKNLAEHSATGHSTLPSVGTRTTDRSIRCIPGLGGNCIMPPLRRVASCPIGCLNVTVLPGNKSCNDASSVFFCLVNPINDRIFRFEQVVPKPFFCYFLYIPASCGRWSPYHSSALRPKARPTNGPHDS